MASKSEEGSGMSLPAEIGTFLCGVCMFSPCPMSKDILAKLTSDSRLPLGVKPGFTPFLAHCHLGFAPGLL